VGTVSVNWSTKKMAQWMLSTVVTLVVKWLITDPIRALVHHKSLISLVLIPFIVAAADFLSALYQVLGHIYRVNKIRGWEHEDNLLKKLAMNEVRKSTYPASHA